MSVFVYTPALLVLCDMFHEGKVPREGGIEDVIKAHDRAEKMADPVQYLARGNSFGRFLW